MSKEYEPGRIFVGGLPNSVDSHSKLEEFFRQFGPVKESKVLLDRASGRPKGYGFIRFERDYSVEDAIRNDQQNIIDGKWVDVKRCEAGRDPAVRGGQQKRRSSSRRRSPPPPRRRSSSRRRSPPRRPPPRAELPPPPPNDPRSRDPRSRSPPRRSPPRRYDPSPRRPPPPRGDSRGRRYNGQTQNSPRRSPPRNEERTPVRYVPPSEQKGKYRITIENLPPDMGWQELKEMGMSFAKLGKCTFARTRRDRSGELEFTSWDDMEKTIRELDNRRFSGSSDRLRAFRE